MPASSTQAYGLIVGVQVDDETGFVVVSVQLTTDPPGSPPRKFPVTGNVATWQAAMGMNVLLTLSLAA
jgi:hypothetical protein